MALAVPSHRPHATDTTKPTTVLFIRVLLINDHQHQRASSSTGRRPVNQYGTANRGSSNNQPSRPIKRHARSGLPPSAACSENLPHDVSFHVILLANRILLAEL